MFAVDFLCLMAHPAHWTSRLESNPFRTLKELTRVGWDQDGEAGANVYPMQAWGTDAAFGYLQHPQQTHQLGMLVPSF